MCSVCVERFLVDKKAGKGLQSWPILRAQLALWGRSESLGGKGSQVEESETEPHNLP